MYRSQDYTAAQGARLMLAGLMIVICCLVETVCRTMEGLVLTMWQYKLQIALGLAALAMCMVVPYVLAGIAYIMIG